jgi:hypothetical protein
MSRERRDTPRRHTYASAFLFTGDGAALGKCIVKDISESGAKLVYTTRDELPSQLLLTMGMDRKPCRVMWRSDKEIGVEFGRSTRKRAKHFVTNLLLPDRPQ